MTAWDVAGSKDRMLKIFSSYHPDVIALLEMAEPSTIRLWKLLDRPALKTWIKGKCALLGDAAHPFLPRAFLPQYFKKPLTITQIKDKEEHRL